MNALLPPPPEWAHQDSVWIGWPSDPDLWEDDLAPARAEVAGLVRAIATSGQRVDLVAAGPEALAAARDAVAEHQGRATVHHFPMGDIWLRDTGPVFSWQQGRLTARRFAFNGWGGKYRLAGDDAVGGAIAEAAGAAVESFDAILEGGAVDWDGAGHLLTTRQCLLNPNRNPGWTESVAETFLREALGARHVIWLDDGLLNDHTDGHVDNIARFIGPNTIACQTPSGPDDPNAEVLREIAASLRAARNIDGAPFDIVTLVSPGRVEDAGGAPVPASHMNFLITNRFVIVPTYGTPGAESAMAALTPHFPGRRVIGLPARHSLNGGGAFHCISQQQPSAPEAAQP
jgi:agmatine deiminase